MAFQPGVWIDWQRREVRVQARTVLRAGPLEFLACFAGKEHESIARLQASATHIYLALGLIGVTPGHPPTWNPQTGTFDAPAGDLLDLSFEWTDDGRRCCADAYDWLCEVEYQRTPLSRPWIFAGSLPRPDGSLWSEVSGVGIALVDFSDSLVCLSRRYPSRYGALWAVANRDAIPPVGTSVWLVLRPAKPRRHRVVLDFRGSASIDGRYCSPADLADLLSLARRLEPTYVQPILIAGALRCDQRDFCRRLIEHGLSTDAFRLEPVP